MGYNVYHGNSGLRRKVETSAPLSPPPPAERPSPPRPSQPTPPPSAVRAGGLPRSLFGRGIDTEDWLVAAVLYLAYRSSGESELLIALLAYMLL